MDVVAEEEDEEGAQVDGEPPAKDESEALLQEHAMATRACLSKQNG